MCTEVRAQDSLPTYEHANDLEAQGFSTEVFHGKEYSMSCSLGKRKFVLFNGVYIRKTTALYLVQENTQFSAARLLRVRAMTVQSEFFLARITFFQVIFAFFREWIAINA